MILQALAVSDVASHIPDFYKEQRVDWICEIDSSGAFVRMTSVGTPKEPYRTILPYIGRTSGVEPKFLSDKAVYVFPYKIYAFERNGRVTPEWKQRLDDSHKSFLELLKDCLVNTGSIEILSVIRFLESENLESVLSSVKGKLYDSDFILFSVDGHTLSMQPEFMGFWTEYVTERLTRKHELSRDEVELKCLVCGAPIHRVKDAYVFEAVAPTNSEKARDAGKPSAVSFVPSDSQALYASSYGLYRGENAPICVACSERMSKNYGELRKTRKVSLGSCDYLILGKHADEAKAYLDPITTPTEESVKALYALRRNRASKLMDYDATYMLMYVSAVSVGRGHFYGKEYDLNETRDRVIEWFEAQHNMAGFQGQYLTPISLLAHLYRKNARGYYEKNSVPSRLSDPVYHAILSGGRWPREVLNLAVERNRREQRVTRGRVLLIYHLIQSEKGVKLLSLDRAENNRGYVLGRLFALLNYAQYAAIGKVNAPLSSKFWSGASTTPAMVFPRLMALYRQHANKLLNGTAGRGIAIEKEMAEILSLLGSRLPRQLSVEEQASFSLGYYHQEAIRFTRNDIPEEDTVESQEFAEEDKDEA